MVVAASAASSSYFQGGDYVELLSAQGKAPASTWKIQGKIIKSFDKVIKGNAFQMDGSSETKMQLPKAPTPSSSSLGLTQRFLVFQLCVPHTRSFSIEIGFSDFQKIRRRLVFASAFRETTMTALHVQIPISTSISRDQWMNFVFDLQALTEHYFPGSSFRSMESICISGSCRLKRVFTMKDAPFCASIEHDLQAPMVAYKQQRLQSKESSNTPTAIAGFVEMKDIPKQFVFNVGASCLPIPTEYFLAVSSPTIAAAQAVPAPATRSVGVKATTSDVKALAAPMRGASKPKSADSRVDKRRAQAPVKPPSPVSTEDVARARSALSARTSEPRIEETNGVRLAKVDNATSRGRMPPSPNGYRVHAAPVEDVSTKAAIRARYSTACADDEEQFEGGALDQNVAEAQTREERGTRGDFSPVHQVVSREQADHSVACAAGASSSTAAHRKRTQRQTVIAEIQSKLDLLTKEAHDEQARERKQFLDCVTIANIPSRQSPMAVGESPTTTAPCPTSSKAKPTNADDPVSQWPDSEPLRSPEPMVLKRLQATKKPEILFSSSIFNFDREASTSAASDDTTVTLGSRRLFDWDSLLEDSASSLLRSATPVENAVQSIRHNRETRKSLEAQNLRDSRSEASESIGCETSRESTAHQLDESRNRAVVERTEEQVPHKGIEFDYLTSPNRRSCDRRESVSSDRSTNLDCAPSPARSDAESDGDVSIDLTDNLREEQRAATSPSSVTSKEEESFNFDELVVRDRDYRPPMTSHTSVPTPPRSSKLTDQPCVAPSTRLHTSEPRHSHSGARDRRPADRFLLASSTSSPLQTPNPEKSPRVKPSSSAHLMSSSQRRLVSLLESTDWSQLPVSSVVSAKAPLVATRERTSHAAADAPRDKQRGASKASASLELIYDPILRCYFDPISNKYYALAK